MKKEARLLPVAMMLLFSAVACSGDGSEQAAHTAADTQGGTGMRLASAAFDHDGLIPPLYTCDGSDVSPPLSLSDVPAGAASLTLVMDDPDAPVGTWDHWVAFDIPVVTEFAENVGPLGTGGLNSWGEVGYGGPCPPGGTHRYFFTVYALDAELGIPRGSTKTQVLEAMDGHVLADATLMGRYSR